MRPMRRALAATLLLAAAATAANSAPAFSDALAARLPALCAPGEVLTAFDAARGAAAGAASCWEPVDLFPPARSCRCLRADCSGDAAGRAACAACARGFAAYATRAECLSAGAGAPAYDPPARPQAAPAAGYGGDAAAAAAAEEAECSDTPPDSAHTCAQQVKWGKCGADWMLAGDFCRRSCGRCAAAAPPAGPLPLPALAAPTSGARPGAQEAAAAAAASCSPPPAASPTDVRTGCPHLAAGLALWNDPATWGAAGVPPADASHRVVTLPAGKKVLLAGCMLPANARFVQIVVPAGSELIFAEALLEFRLASLLVRGALRAGAPTCRLASRVTLVFEQQGVDAADFGVLAPPGGSLDIHGRRFAPTWTRLAASAPAGAAELRLQAAVNWGVGDQLAVATSAYRDLLEDRNEVRTVTAISADRRTLALNAPLTFGHYGGGEYQSEVALLTRSIRLLGVSGTAAAALGPHLRAESSTRIAGVLAYRFGQRNALGRYPFHFHMMGDGAGSFVTDSAVYDSYYRCYVLHGTSNARLENNVGFSVDGSCFYLEDGVEERNTLAGNFAGLVRPIGPPAGGAGQEGATVAESAAVAQPADAAAAGFYMTNPNNDLVGNAASGGALGFAVLVLEKPIGLSRDVAIVPAARPWGRFARNTAHSSGYFAVQTSACMYFGGKLWEAADSSAATGRRLTYSSGRFDFPTRGADGAPATPRVEDNAVWLCSHGLLAWGQRLDVLGFTSHDAMRPLALLGRSFVRGFAASGSSANAAAAGFPGDRAGAVEQAGFGWYDTGTQTIVKDAAFSNWRAQPELGALAPAVWTGLVYGDQFKPEGMSVTRNVTYRGVDRDAILRYDVLPMGASRMFNWIDTDGSSVLAAAPTIVGAAPRWWDLGGGCAFNTVWQAWPCAKHPDQTVGRLDVRIPGYTFDRANAVVPPTPANDMGYVAQFGRDVAGNLLSMTVTRNEGVTGVTGPTGWYFHFARGAPKETTIFLTQVPVGRYILYASRYPAATTFSIRRIFKYYADLDRDVVRAGSAEEVANDPAGLKYFFDGRILYLKLVDPQPVPASDLVREGVTLYGTRWFNLQYSVKTNLGAQFSALPAPDPGPPPRVAAPAATAAPLALPTPARPETAACDDRPPFGATCAELVRAGLCAAPYVRAGGWCGTACGRCPTAAAAAP